MFDASFNTLSNAIEFTQFGAVLAKLHPSKRRGWTFKRIRFSVKVDAAGLSDARDDREWGKRGVRDGKPTRASRSSVGWRF